MTEPFMLFVLVVVAIGLPVILINHMAAKWDAYDLLDMCHLLWIEFVLVVIGAPAILWSTA